MLKFFYKLYRVNMQAALNTHREEEGGRALEERSDNRRS